MNGLAQECVEKTWGLREHFSVNIKVTTVKGQEHEAPENRCEEELGMMGPVQEAGRERRPADRTNLFGKRKTGKRAQPLEKPL